MRIAHVTDCYLPRLGGIEMQVADLAARQREAGHDVEVVTTSPLGAAGLVELHGQAGDPEWVRRVGVGDLGRSWRAALAPVVGAGRFHPGDYDVVHAHLSLVSPFTTSAVVTSARAGVPTVATVHSMWSGYGPIPTCIGALLGLRRLPVAWTAVSAAAAGPVRQTLGRRCTPMILPNAVDPLAWVTEPAPRGRQQVVIASVMRLSRRKRPAALLAMLRRMRQLTSPGVDVRAVIIGDGPDRPRLERYVDRHSMADWVSLPGRLERGEIRDVFAGADVYVAPADLESFGIAALEARCAGLPVVAKRSGGVGEFVSHGLDGLLVGSDTEMVQALASLTESPAVRARMSAHSRRHQPPLSWPHALRRSMQAYAHAVDLLAGRRRDSALDLDRIGSPEVAA